MKTGIRLEGADEMDASLERLHGMTDEDALRALGFEALEPVADAARGLVRKRTGVLAASIGVGDHLSPAQAAQNTPEPGTVEVYVGPGSMTRAITEEFGTVREVGHPYMRPAWMGQLGEVQQRLRTGAARLLRSLTKG
ncbi:hypothetical protein [Sphingomonas sp. S2-65]|uniref:hypothetical protein n=1 Tax=Sphingomonas sp. S2-65 TaxID=2903960 RepID=UPI001F268094|nr:hypothetical protein [Sphingomonas sp. S2-65]UYY60108.1 hypothetical protein LZ586_08530 [Sphingomonas sp. S2-65]